MDNHHLPIEAWLAGLPFTVSISTQELPSSCLILCHPSLPSFSAILLCHPSLPSFSAILLCHPSLPSFSAILLCRPSLPSFSAVLLCHPSLPSFSAILLCPLCCSLLCLALLPVCFPLLLPSFLPGLSPFFPPTSPQLPPEPHQGAFNWIRDRYGMDLTNQTWMPQFPIGLLDPSPADVAACSQSPTARCAEEPSEELIGLFARNSGEENGAPAALFNASLESINAGVMLLRRSPLTFQVGQGVMLLRRSPLTFQVGGHHWFKSPRQNVPAVLSYASFKSISEGVMLLRCSALTLQFLDTWYNEEPSNRHLQEATWEQNRLNRIAPLFAKHLVVVPYLELTGPEGRQVRHVWSMVGRHRDEALRAALLGALLANEVATKEDDWTPRG
ncbi:unnamed protein product [Closterium sp. Naga37s-1]|nr:unnamed protein product [Closterium sp. Naga37s-1]